MQAKVIVESCFGNTARIAEAVTEGLRAAGVETELIAAGQAPRRIDADLVLIAAPTHNMGLPKPQTRQQAVEKGAAGASSAGVREWIEGLESIDERVVAISTTTGGSFAGSAGKAAVKALRRRKIKAERGEDFIVNGTAGPLADGEVERARDWANTLVSG